MFIGISIKVFILSRFSHFVVFCTISLLLETSGTRSLNERRSWSFDRDINVKLYRASTTGEIRQGSVANIIFHRSIHLFCSATNRIPTTGLFPK